MQILVSIGTAGASPQISEIVTVFDCPVLSCPYLFFLDPTPRSNRWTDFHASWLKRQVSAQGLSFWGVRTMGDHIWGKYAPKTPQKWA